MDHDGWGTDKSIPKNERKKDRKKIIIPTVFFSGASCLVLCVRLQSLPLPLHRHRSLRYCWKPPEILRENLCFKSTHHTYACSHPSRFFFFFFCSLLFNYFHWLCAIVRACVSIPKSDSFFLFTFLNYFVKVYRVFWIR